MESKLTPNKYMKVNTGNIFFPRVLMVILLCLTASSIFAQSKAENKTGEFCTRTDIFNNGSGADSRGQKDASTDLGMAAARIICILFADILAALAYCRNDLAQIEIRMVVGGRLRVERTFAVCGQTSAFGVWKKLENKIYSLFKHNSA